MLFKTQYIFLEFRMKIYCDTNDMENLQRVSYHGLIHE